VHYPLPRLSFSAFPLLPAPSPAFCSVPSSLPAHHPAFPRLSTPSSSPRKAFALLVASMLLVRTRSPRIKLLRRRASRSRYLLDLTWQYLPHRAVKRVITEHKFSTASTALHHISAPVLHVSSAVRRDSSALGHINASLSAQLQQCRDRFRGSSTHNISSPVLHVETPESPN